MRNAAGIVALSVGAIVVSVVRGQSQVGMIHTLYDSVPARILVISGSVLAFGFFGGPLVRFWLGSALIEVVDGAALRAVVSFGRVRVVPFGDIQRIEVRTVGGGSTLDVFTQRGAKVHVNFQPEGATWMEVVTVIDEGKRTGDWPQR